MLFCEKFGLAAWERESVRTPPEGQRCSFGRQPSRGPRRMRETVALATPAPCLSRREQTLCHYAGADRDDRATEVTPVSYPLRLILGYRHSHLSRTTSYRHSLPCVTYSPCSEARHTVPQHTTSAHPLPLCGHNSTDAAHELLRITLQRTTAPRACHCLLRTASLCLGTSQVRKASMQQLYIIFLKLYQSWIIFLF